MIHPTPRLAGAFRRPYVKAGLAFLAGLPAVVTVGLAQAATNAPAADSSTKTKPADDEVVELNPFVISSSQDKGYVPQSSVAGSRLGTSLYDVASPVTSFTSELMEDLGVTDTDDLAKYMLSTEYDYGEEAGGQNRLNNEGKGLRMRGLPGGTTSVNFFATDFRLDSFSADRIDQARGPNGILFGIGSPGGLINGTTKRAILGTTKGSVSYSAKTWNGSRAEMDLNVPVGSKFALRFAAMDEAQNSWRNWEYDDGERVFVTGKLALTRKTEINVEYEVGNLDKSTKRTFTALDGYSLYAADPVAANTQNIGTAGQVVYNYQDNTVRNWTGGKTSKNVTDDEGQAIAFQDFSLLPKEVSFLGPGYAQNTDYDRITAFLSHRFTSNLTAEAAYFHLGSRRYVLDVPQGTNYLRIDVNPTYTDGTTNPYFGKPYFEGYDQLSTFFSSTDAARFSVAYNKDLGRLGKHTLAGVYQYTNNDDKGQVLRETLTNYVRTTTNLNANTNLFYRQNYLDFAGPSSALSMGDPGLFDPNTTPINMIGSGLAYYNTATNKTVNVANAPITTAWVPNGNNADYHNSSKQNTLIGMLQSRWWNGKVQTIVGLSQDRLTQSKSSLTDEYVNSSGNTVQISNRSQTAVPGYSTAYQDPAHPEYGVVGGMLTAIDNYDRTDFINNTTSFSVVYHVIDWLSLTYNQANNAPPPGTRGYAAAIDGGGGPLPQAHGRSKDYGVKFNFLNGDLYATLTYFRTAATSDSDFTLGVAASDINPIWNTFIALNNDYVVPNDASSGLNTANDVYLPNGQLVNNFSLSGVTAESFDSATDGWEFEVVANPTKNWRLFANFNAAKTERTNIARATQAYIDYWAPYWRSLGNIPLDNGTGTVNDQVDRIEALAYSAYVLGDGKEPVGQMPWRGNLQTTYTFDDGAMKGISLGFGVRANGGPLIAYESDVDPNDSTKIIRTAIYEKDQYYLDLNAAYRRKLSLFGNRCTWVLQLKVNNVLDNNDEVVLKLSRGGEVRAYRFTDPTEVIVKSTLQF